MIWEEVGIVIEVEVGLVVESLSPSSCDFTMWEIVESCESMALEVTKSPWQEAVLIVSSIRSARFW